jgi:hypothetical protein
MTGSTAKRTGCHASSKNRVDITRPSVAALPHSLLIAAAATHRRFLARYRHADALIGRNLTVL